MMLPDPFINLYQYSNNIHKLHCIASLPQKTFYKLSLSYFANHELFEALLLLDKQTIPTIKNIGTVKKNKYQN